MPVICVDLEPALRWRKPAVNDATHDKPALAEPEGERLRFTATAGAALNTNRHGLRYRRSLVQFPDVFLPQSESRRLSRDP